MYGLKHLSVSGILYHSYPTESHSFPPNDYECFKNLFVFIEDVAFYIFLKRFFFNQQRGKILEWVVTDIMGMNEIICSKWYFYFLYVIRKGLGKGDKWRDLHLMPSFPFPSLGSSPYRRVQSMFVDSSNHMSQFCPPMPSCKELPHAAHLGPKGMSLSGVLCL